MSGFGFGPAGGRTTGTGMDPSPGKRERHFVVYVVAGPDPDPGQPGAAARRLRLAVNRWLGDHARDAQVVSIVPGPVFDGEGPSVQILYRASAERL